MSWAAECADRWDALGNPDSTHVSFSVRKAIAMAVTEALSKAAHVVEECENGDYDPTGKASEIAAKSIRALMKEPPMAAPLCQHGRNCSLEGAIPCPEYIMARYAALRSR